MSKRLKSIENNEVSFIESKQISKQMTLFDMKSKGKFSISSDKEFSPKPETKQETKIKSDEDDDVVVINENVENIQIKNTPKKVKKKKNEMNCSKMKNFLIQASDTEAQIEEKSTLNSNKNIIDKSVGKKIKSDNSNDTLNQKLQKFASVVKENGNFVLGDSSSNLQNHMFGEVAVVIELYNLIVDIFNKKFIKSKKKKKSQKQLDLLKIDLDQFILVFNSDSVEGKAYFVKIIQNLLKIFIVHEKIFGFKLPFNYFFDNLTFDPCFLQELTRYVLNIVTSHIEYEETDSELDLLYSQDNLVKGIPLIKDLATNYSEEPFGDLDSTSKLELLRLLCEDLLLTKTFKSFKTTLEEDIEKNKTKLKESKNEASDLLLKLKSASSNPTAMAKGYKHWYFSKFILDRKTSKKISSKLHKNKKTSYCERLNTRVKNQTELSEKLNRLKPIGMYCDSFYIWKFSFLDGVVVELINNKKSEWYILDKSKNIQAVIDFLNKTKFSEFNGSKLCSKLKGIEENLNKEAQSDSDDQSEESDSNEKIPEKKYSLRKSSNSTSVKAESTEAEDSEDEQLNAYLKTKDHRIDFMRKLASVSAKFDWIQFNDLTYSIDGLWKYLIEQVAKVYYYGIANETVFNQAITILKSYSNENEFSKKLKIIKDAMILFRELMNNPNHIKHLLLKNGKMLPNGKRLVYELEDFIKSCESVSALYLMTYFLMSSVKWTNFRSMKPCIVCAEKYDENDFNEFVNEKIFSQDDYSNFGFFTCSKCFMPTHKKCDTLVDDKLSLTCKICLEKAMKFSLMDLEQDDEKNEIEIPSPEKVFKGGKLLRKKKSVNYKLSDSYKPRMMPEDNDSIDGTSLSSNSIASNSNSSLRVRHSRKVSDTVPQRSSDRLRNSSIKNYFED